MTTKQADALQWLCVLIIFILLLIGAMYLWTIGNSKTLKVRRKLYVVICFQISIFEPLETAAEGMAIDDNLLWFAFKLVSLNHWKQREYWGAFGSCVVIGNSTNKESVQLIKVVICFQISIFEPLETAYSLYQRNLM